MINRMNPAKFRRLLILRNGIDALYAETRILSDYILSITNFQQGYSGLDLLGEQVKAANERLSRLKDEILSKEKELADLEKEDAA